jgi:hypothetical protein
VISPRKLFSRVSKCTNYGVQSWTEAQRSVRGIPISIPCSRRSCNNVVFKGFCPTLSVDKLEGGQKLAVFIQSWNGIKDISKLVEFLWHLAQGFGVNVAYLRNCHTLPSRELVSFPCCRTRISAEVDLASRRES